MAIHTIVAATAALALCLVATSATTPAAGAHPLPSPPASSPMATSPSRRPQASARSSTPPSGTSASTSLPSASHRRSLSRRPQRDIQRAVLCARNASLAIRVRAGGHSYEGLSYTTENHVPFVDIDVACTVSASTRPRRRSGPSPARRWASTLAFPGGTCSTLGLGGFVSGGGFGLLSRKHGLAADNVLDETLVDAGGRALTRATMDADVFWAIRGGGGGSWGVVYSWKLRLVHVPATITVFDIERRGPADLIAGLIHKWQYVGPHLPDEFYISTRIYFKPKPTNGGNLTMSFTGQVLVPKHLALSVLNKAYPELRLAESELAEVSWVESTAKFAGLYSIGVGEYAKRKSDYVQAPISKPDMVKIARYMTAAPTEGSIQLNPYGAAMARIGSGEVPFPHRAGFLYSVQYAVDWKAAENGRAGEFMGNPRGAYVNYVDLDLGTNNWTDATGQKSKIDPRNVFNNAQSIPPSH
uniref:FAD-binding PCMH-type domain-containing protein n=1 Tax=Setaria viridis TaxID=4556 RepID=A0A4U6U651_SETVI|nr:LOW QUALITY PROTEIN: hypothetical protein SEVIR_6G052600v2 [Setaria viridis]